MKFYIEKRLEFSSDELEKITGYQLKNYFGVYAFVRGELTISEQEEGYIELTNHIRKELMEYVEKWFLQPRLPEDTKFHTWLYAFNPSLHEQNTTRVVLAWKTVQEETI